MSWTVRALIGALALTAVGCGRHDSPSERREPSPVASARRVESSPQTRPRIVFLGDSLTAGYGLEKEQSVPSLIQARLSDEGYRYEVINAGVSGDTSAGGLSRLDWSLAGNVAVLVVELGVNDGLRGLPVDALRHNLDEIIRKARQRGIAVLLTGMEAPPNYGAAYTAEFRSTYRDLAQQRGVAFVPFYLEGVAGNPTLNIADGMHPNAEGARIVEHTIWSALEPLLARTTGGANSTR